MNVQDAIERLNAHCESGDPGMAICAAVNVLIAELDRRAELYREARKHSYCLHCNDGKSLDDYDAETERRLAGK